MSGAELVDVAQDDQIVTEQLGLSEVGELRQVDDGWPQRREFRLCPLGKRVEGEPQIFAGPVVAVGGRLAVDQQHRNGVLDRDDDGADVVEVEGIVTEPHLNRVGSRLGELVAEADGGDLAGAEVDEFLADDARVERRLVGGFAGLADQQLDTDIGLVLLAEVAQRSENGRVHAGGDERHLDAQVHDGEVVQVVAADIDEHRAGPLLDVGEDGLGLVAGFLGGIGGGQTGPCRLLQVGDEVHHLRGVALGGLGELGADHVERGGH
jgi:hypothetical protein